MPIESHARKHAQADQTAIVREIHNSAPMGAGAGDYRLGARLQASGDVYEAVHPRVSGPFVIKVFPRESGEDAAAVDAFLAEAGRVSILRHKHIAQVLDAGVLRDGRPFVAMERLLGGTLEDWLADQGPVSEFQVLRMARALASALSAAHAVGIVHGEIRPDNVFVVEPVGHHPSTVKVLDFGVSRLMTWATNPPGPGVSPSAMRYLAPEQVRDEREQIDGRTDEFGLAALLTRMLNGSAVHPHSVGQSVRGGSLVDAVLHKALSQRPDDRFASVALFFAAFEEASFTQILTPTRDQGTATSEVGSNLAITREVASRSSAAGRDLPSPPGAIHRKGVVTREFFEDGDRIPRRRGPLLAVLTMAATIAVGVFAKSDVSRWSPPASRHSPIGLATGTNIPAGSPPPSAGPSEAALAAKDDSSVSIPPLSARPEMQKAEQHRGSSALRGYVWSPHEKRLVSSGLIATTSLRDQAREP